MDEGVEECGGEGERGEGEGERRDGVHLVVEMGFAEEGYGGEEGGGGEEEIGFAES